MENIERKREVKTRRRKIRRVLTVFFLVIVFLLWSIYSLLKSDLLNLENIEIYGNDVLTEEEIISAAGLHTGRNIFQYNLLEVKENVDKIPFVKEVTIKRKLPKQ